MELGRMFGRGLAFPPGLGPDGRAAWSAGSENIRESIRIILTTQTGERLMLPEFGTSLPGMLFEPNTVATRKLIQDQIVTALKRWEPRISVQSVVVSGDPED